ncbi:MAG: Ppx/GppA family phosphatase [Actinomycetota bacterium]|nr:Ppx/GppA family phosphatase [Actinomycetota bacterium]
MTSPAPGPVAAIDSGTNSTRLLVVDPAGQTLDRRMHITRLGQGVDRTHALAPAAIERTIAVLRQYRQVMDRHGVARVRMTATSAARDAANREDFFAAAEAAIGVRPELLTGDQEARLSFAGATASLDPGDGPFLVVDIGGGSTEFAFGPAPDGEPHVPTGALSVDVGCVRLTERFLHGDPPRPEELVQALSVVDSYLDDVAREIPDVAEAARLVGLAGTVTTMAAVEIGLATYSRDKIHHFVLSREAVEDVFRTLATERRADRIANPGLEEARADVIVGGSLILVAIMRRFGFAECLVSEDDILDGLAQSLRTVE